MTSGIYLLNFKDQAFYIGQSQDIETRWKQHRDKFVKGKAAEKMQSAYNHYGMPMGRILVECHKDFLDTFENYFIWDQKQFPGCLNTSAPQPDLTINYDFLLTQKDLIMASPVELIEASISILKDLDVVELKLKELQESYDSEYMQIAAEVELRDGKDENADLVVEYQEQLEILENKLEIADLAIKRLLSRNWYQRLFNHL